jgi:hypothetical protein
MLVMLGSDMNGVNSNFEEIRMKAIKNYVNEIEQSKN